MSSQPQRVRSGLRPLPFRGDLIAAGAIPLAVGVALADLRMDGTWAAGVRAAVVALAAALLLALAWRAPVEGPNPRAYVSVLLFSAFPLCALSLLALAQALGGSTESAGTLTWTALALGAGYVALARARNSATCTFLGGTALFVAVLAFWAWAFSFQWWPCLVLIPLLALGVVGLRDRHRPHAVALADLVGVIGVYLVGTEAVQATFGTVGAVFVAPDGTTSDAGSFLLGWGWQLVFLATGLALVGYGAVDRERGPAWFGAVILGCFALDTAVHASLLWWPVLLIALGAAAIVAGLRPTTPTPPSPDAEAELAQERRFTRG